MLVTVQNFAMEDLETDLVLILKGLPVQGRWHWFSFPCFNIDSYCCLMCDQGTEFLLKY